MNECRAKKSANLSTSRKNPNGYSAFSLSDYCYTFKQLRQFLDTLTNLPTCRNVKKITYYNIPCAFDIETTSFYSGEDKQAVMYVWQLGINGRCIIGRTWSQFIQVMSEISKALDLHAGRRLVIYVHSLSYEFQFIRKYFEFDEVFATDTRKVLYATTTNGFEFRCSYLLTNLSLAKVGENLKKYNVRKLPDFDYSLKRLPCTPLTDTEILYCLNDIKVVMAHIAECLESEVYIYNIPLTSTGYVRRHCRRECIGWNKDTKLQKEKYRYRNMVQRLTLSTDEYRYMKGAFAGGFTHANYLYCDEVVKNVTSMDFTSSYPYHLIAYQEYPMSVGKERHPKTLEEFHKYINIYACVFDITFSNIRPKIHQENIISESKCFGVRGAITNNGRIVSADRLSTIITNIDFQSISRFYEWDNISVGTMYTYIKGYLPKLLIQCILDFYVGKTTLKGVEGKEEEYLNSKAMLNSVYGMMVTDIAKPEQIYDSDEWQEPIPTNIDEAIEQYNTNKKRFLFYPWGVFCTALARRSLFEGIAYLCETSNDYIYADTDSIKLRNYENHKHYFEKYNAKVRQLLLDMCNHYGLPADKVEPSTIKGEKKLCGVYDFDGFYTRFKTLGAKRYMVEHQGEYSLTVSGLNKKTAIPYLLSLGGDIFTNFTDDMEIPKGHAGKMTHTYIDEDIKGITTDYNGKEWEYAERSVVHLEDASYNLSLADNYIKFIITNKRSVQE